MNPIKNTIYGAQHCARHMTALVAASLTLLVAGCSTLTVGSKAEFSCPGMPSGVICQSPQQVYSSTHGNGQVNASPQVGQKNDLVAPMPANFVLPRGGALQPITGAPMPLREPARVMRVWIAPWVEKKTDNLHWPSYVFAEVQPRKWSVGRPEFGAMRASQPLYVRQTVAQMPISSPQSAVPNVVSAPGVSEQGTSVPAPYAQPSGPGPSGIGSQGVIAHPYN